jgi:hypothetical protein
MGILKRRKPRDLEINIKKRKNNKRWGVAKLSVIHSMKQK